MIEFPASQVAYDRRPIKISTGVQMIFLLEDIWRKIFEELIVSVISSRTAGFPTANWLASGFFVNRIRKSAALLR